MKRHPLFPIIQNLLAIALPISAGRMLYILANFIAMMMVAPFGKDQLAAGFLAVSSTIPITTSLVTIFYATGIRIRYYLGRKDAQAGIEILLKNSLFLAMIFAIPAAFFINHMDSVLLAFGLESRVVLLTTAYFHYAGLGVFPLLAMAVIGQFYVGIGKPSYALIIEIISFPLTILTSYALISGHFGFSASGLAGVSLANLVVQSGLLIAMLAMSSLNNKTGVYRLFNTISAINWRVCKPILTLGLPIGIQFGGELAAIAVAGYFMGYFGVDALAALQIASQYSILVIMLGVGLTQALSLKISEIYGQNTANSPLIKKYLLASMLLLMVYVLPVSLLFCTASTKLAEYYMGTTNLRPDFAYFIRVFFALSAAFLCVDGVRNLLTGALRGLHHSKTASNINIAALWLVSIPVSGLVVFVFKGGPVLLRMGFLSGFIVAVVALALYLYKKLTRIPHASMPTNLVRTATT